MADDTDDDDVTDDETERDPENKSESNFVDSGLRGEFSEKDSTLFFVFLIDGPQFESRQDLD